jgi:hypothetical protein
MKPIHRTFAVAATVLLATAGSVVAVAAPAAAGTGPTVSAGVAGTGTASAVRVVNLADLPVDTAPSVSAPVADRRARTLPSLPTTGRRPAPVAAKAEGAMANTSPGRPAVSPQVAPGVVANFAGINQAAGCGGCQPSDVNAAVGTTQILESVNVTMRAMTKTGATLCTRPLGTFLGTTDALTDPRVLFDNVNNRFSLVVTVKTPAGATPALWVAASQANNACGAWNIYRITFSGGSFPLGTVLDYPIMGQDRTALLFGTDNFTPTGENFTVFGIPKSAVYSGAGFSFSAFNTASLVAPAINGGIPMVTTTLSYFLGAVPGVGYRLYTLTNHGGPGAVLTLRATISAPFNPPSRGVNQPGSTVTLDPLDGRIAWSPILAANNFLWFAHGIDLAGFPTVRYGAINVVSNTSGGMAVAYRSGTSDDFNPSISVGNNPGGNAWIFVNWAYTDTSAGVATSMTVDMVPPGGGVPNLIGTGAVLVNGSSTTQFRFGDYSSVDIDPAVPNGSCAVAAQQYFVAGGTWTTRIGRIGTC